MYPNPSPKTMVMNKAWKSRKIFNCKQTRMRFVRPMMVGGKKVGKTMKKEWLGIIKLSSAALFIGDPLLCRVVFGKAAVMVGIQNI